jgi:hypothetical protein
MGAITVLESHMENNGNQRTKEQLEQDIKELDNKYAGGLSVMAANTLQVNQTFLDSLEKRDKLIGENLTFSLLVLAVASTLLSAKSDVIQTKPLFIFSLVLLAIVVIFSSISRNIFRNRLSSASLKNFQEYRERNAAILPFLLNPRDPDSKAKMEYLMQNDQFKMQETFFTKNSTMICTTIFTTAFILLIISIVLKISFLI